MAGSGHDPLLGTASLAISGALNTEVRPIGKLKDDGRSGNLLVVFPARKDPSETSSSRTRG